MRPMALAHLHKLHRLQEPLQIFLVDNGFLKAKTDGLGFRRSKCLEDLLPGSLAPWRSTVQGVDEGDGWLRVGMSYLPFFVKGIPVLCAVPRSPSARSSPRSPPPPSPAVPSGPSKSWTPMIASQAVAFDFEALRELVSLLRSCRKKVSKGQRPSVAAQRLVSGSHKAAHRVTAKSSALKIVMVICSYVPRSGAMPRSPPPGRA